MLKQVLVCALLITSGTAGTSLAEPRNPGDAALGSRIITRTQLTEIVTWLSTNFDLPAVHDHPRVEFAPPLRIAAMRYKGVLPLAWREDSIQDPAVQAATRRDVVAIYNDTTRTIFLPEGWVGTNPAEMSVLVHEMVHHLQNVAAMKFDCPAAREKVAYQAQNQWLQRFDRDLEQDFEIDMMTLLVTTSCMN